MSKRNPGGLISTTGLREPSATDQSQNSGVWDLDEQYRAGTNGTWANQSGQVYGIGNSLRHSRSRNTFLSRTLSVAGNPRIATYSVWIKKSFVNAGSNTADSGRTFVLLSSNTAGSDVSTFGVTFTTSDQLVVINQEAAIVTSAVFRDPSAWLHIVAHVDSTKSTASERTVLFVNGVRVTSFASASYPTLNAANLHLANYHIITGDIYGSGRTLDGYIAESNYIDGQALTADHFGYYDFNGVWQPKKYTGSYGTVGFYLPFNPTAYGDSITTTTLGFDKSGNGNNFTTNNISVAAGVNYDLMVDSPTNSSSTADTGLGGQLGGNYATWNAIAQSTVVNGTVTRSNGSLTSTDGGTTYGLASFGTIAVTTGKWYWETTITSAGGTFARVGVVDLNSSLRAGVHTAIVYCQDGGKSTGSDVFNGSAQTTYGASYTTGDIIGTAIDLDAGTITFYKNGVSQGVAYSSISGNYTPAVGDAQNATSYTFDLNCGQRPFAYAAPAGFKCLNTANLPQPAIPDGGEYFNTVLYTGNGTAGRAIDTNLATDLFWVKQRSGANVHYLTDIVRGALRGLSSNLTDAESTFDSVRSFTSTGVTVGTSATTNSSGQSYVAWCWRANGAGVSNTAGSITSTVSAGVTQGFSIVTYTGVATNNTNFTVGHGLGVKPAMIIIKNRGWAASSKGWSVFHQAISTGGVFLDSTDISESQNFNFFWGEQPNSTTFSIRSDTTVSEPNRFRTNGRTDGYVAYCFAEVPGFSKFGSYTGNGSADGPFVFTGFRPAWLMWKRTDANSNWTIMDTEIAPFNPGNNVLRASLADAQASSGTGAIIDILSNGYKIRNSGTEHNASGGTYIYMAFAEHPFKTSRAR